MRVWFEYINVYACECMQVFMFEYFYYIDQRVFLWCCDLNTLVGSIFALLLVYRQHFAPDRKGPDKTAEPAQFVLHFWLQPQLLQTGKPKQDSTN